MKRIMFLMVVVIGIATPKAHAAWHYYDGGWHWVDYGRDYSGRGGNGYVDRGGYGYGPAGYSDRSWYGGSCGDNNEVLYGPGSVSDFVFGWRADRVLKMHEKDQEFRHDQVRRVEEKKIFQRANQAGKLQHEIERIEKEKQELLLREKIAELEKKIDQLLATKAGK